MITTTPPAGVLRAIWVKRAKRGPLDPRPSALLVAGRGLLSNKDQGGRRQVTLLEAERWAEAVAELGVDVEPRARRANLMLAGFPLTNTRGRILAIGSTRLRILGETRPCERMDEAEPGLRRILEVPWRAGAFAEVLTGGEIAVGDVVRWREGAGSALGD